MASCRLGMPCRSRATRACALVLHNRPRVTSTPPRRSHTTSHVKSQSITHPQGNRPHPFTSILTRTHLLAHDTPITSRYGTAQVTQHPHWSLRLLPRPCNCCNRLWNQLCNHQRASWGAAGPCGCTLHRAQEQPDGQGVESQYHTHRQLKHAAVGWLLCISMFRARPRGCLEYRIEVPKSKCATLCAACDTTLIRKWDGLSKV